MNYVAFLLLKRVLCESKHKYLETDLYYTVICSAVNCFLHLLLWIPSAFFERTGATVFLAKAHA